MIPPGLLSSNSMTGLSGILGQPDQPMYPSKRHDSLASSGASSGKFGTMKSSTKRSGGNRGSKIGFVQESAASLRKRIVAEIGASVYQSISDVSYVNFLEWIRSERLTTLPHEGSRWDRVLIRALNFAEQLHKFEQAIQGFAQDSSTAASLGYGHAQLLLELGHENSEALDKAFSVFYKFEVSFSSVLHSTEMLAATPEVREQLCLLYTDLLSLVVDVAIRFYKIVNGLTSGSTSLDIFDVFGNTIESFRTRQKSVVEAIWKHQIDNEWNDDGEVFDVNILNGWLKPQDRVIESLNRDHSISVDQQAEFTCLWFQKHLTGFIRSDKKSLLVTAQAGGGKTTLAGSVVERLQRPVNHKQYDTIFCSLSPDIPTTATPLAMVKSLLFQLLNTRVGNMDIYLALVRAYHQCHTSSDMKTYENHLWQALSDTLKQPLGNSNELVVVVDGLDEIAGSQSASIQSTGAVDPPALLEKLTTIINASRSVRLITFSSSDKLLAQPNGVVYEVSRSDVRQDLHAVALRSLLHNLNFHGHKGYNQETMIDRLIQTAYGSFLWTILACQILNAQKSSEDITKTLESLESKKPSVQDLVLQLCNTLSTTNDAKTLLSWILAAERPLTVDEVHTLFSIDVQRGTLSDKGINVKDIISTVSPLLNVQERIMRFKHPVIHSILHNLAHQNKVPIPLKESEKDLLLRVLTYAKATLRDPSEPTMNNLDPSLPGRLFSQHQLLEYTVLYWVSHLHQSPLAPTSANYRPNSELQKALPETVLLPILEQICWDTRLPIPQALDLHMLAATVRQGTFTENHPTVLQTYITIATNYLLMSKPAESSTYLYRASRISRTVMGYSHPLTIECANCFIRITNSMTTPTRTEIMTHREEILILLITAYEKQHGSQSEMVVQTRELLAELYTCMHEEEKAKEVYHSMHQTTVQHYGPDSHQAQDMQNHLNVVLGKGKEDQVISGYQDSLFHDQDEEAQESLQIHDAASINVYLQKAEAYAAKKEYLLAEQSFVELWMEVSTMCSTVQSIELHEQHIKVATAYSRFLKSQKRTSESSAILMAIWQQYEHHQVSYSEQIVQQLLIVANEMKTVGMSATALSIFKFASAFYKNVRQEDTESSREVDKQLSETSNEIVNQNLGSSSVTTTTTSTVSESIIQDSFLSILQSSKTVDSKTVALSQKLVSQYMKNKDYSSAINVLHASLERIWPSFLSTSIQDVTMTSKFTRESIELVESLAECYRQTKQKAKVEETYSRFFRAALATHNVDQTILDRATTLLLNYYDNNRYADNAIAVLQDILVNYRTRYGPTHGLTIRVLYDLARRCQAHSRNHPYWIEYYLQIITSLNKDSDTCHKDALCAIDIVTNTYWEDRRYAEAATIYRVLWNTFVKEAKQHKVFSDTKFVQTLYEHYTECLEETNASKESLFQVANHYRETCVATFGSNSSIAVQASLSLAQVAQQSEEHASTAISLYEELSKLSHTTSVTSTSEINQALSSLYANQMQSSSASSNQAETLSHAISITQERLRESCQKYGYSHESSLSLLKELSTLYHRQQKTDVAIKLLTTAVSEIVSKETSSQSMIESAASIASTFDAIQQTSTGNSLVHELHRQICAKDSPYASKWPFDLTKSDRSALAFLASLQYNLRKDLSVTFGEIMADLTMEYLYFEKFRDTLRQNESLANILLSAAPLRFFLRRNKHHEMMAIVEDQAVALFTKRDTHSLNILSKEAPHIFIAGILDHLGNGRNRNFNRSVIMSSNDSVSKLTQSKKFLEAYDIANLSFLYASKHDMYNGPQAISMGFKLASLLAGRDSEKCPDAELRKKMLDLSNRIVHKILETCEHMNINFAQVQLYELSQLSVLLAEQQDWATLEWLLTKLWNTRDAQQNWPPKVLQNLGRRLICARFLAGHPVKAIRLCEDIAYNLRRAHGPRAPVTIETYELLAQLYTSTAQSYQSKASSEQTGPLAQEYFKKALEVPEDILRLIVHDESTGDDSVDEQDTTARLLANEGVDMKSLEGTEKASLDEGNLDKSAVARRNLHLLKLAYQRLGRWPKPYEEYERLNSEIFREFGGNADWRGAQGTDKWNAKSFGAGKAESQEGGFEGLKDWALGSESLTWQSEQPSQVAAYA